ncbi:MAG: hypothetical protein AAF491_11360 [Verrucomicrobiota bacterium]
MPRPTSARTVNTAYHLKNSIVSFFVEYRRFPLEIDGADLSTTTDFPLMSILVGAENEVARKINPRGIAFFSDRKAKVVDGKYIGGLQTVNDERCILWDTWGNQFLVRMDTDYDNRVLSPEDPVQLIPDSVLVWSAGPDGDFSTWKDNVKTW